MATYGREQRDRAVDLYIKYERCAADVIRELGHPGKGALLSWYADQCVLMLLYSVKRLGVLFWVGCRVYPLDGPLLEFGKVACAAFDLAVDWL